MNRKSSINAFLILIVATTINTISGILYTWSVFSRGLTKQLYWTNTQSTLPYTFAIIFYVFGMILFGELVNSYGPKKSIMVAGSLMGIGLFLTGLTTSPIVMIITFGILTGTGIGISNVVTTPTALKWFPSKMKGVVTGLVIAGIGLSSLIYAPLTQYFINSIGISKTFMLLGCGVFVLLMVLSQFLVVPTLTVSENNSEIDNPNLQNNQNWKQMIKTLFFKKIWVCMILSSSAGLMIISNITSIAKLQINWENGFILVMLLAVSNTVGRLFGGLMSDKIGSTRTLQLVFVIQMIIMLFFASITEIFFLSVGFAIIGFCYGASFSAFPTVILSNFGIKEFGKNYGILMTGWGLGGVIGPILAALNKDVFGNYSISYLITAAFLLCAIILMSSTIGSVKNHV